MKKTLKPFGSTSKWSLRSKLQGVLAPLKHAVIEKRTTIDKPARIKNKLCCMIEKTYTTKTTVNPRYFEKGTEETVTDKQESLKLIAKLQRRLKILDGGFDPGSG